MSLKKQSPIKLINFATIYVKRKVKWPLPEAIDFFSYKLSDFSINYLNSSIGGYKMHKIGIKIILYYFCNIPIRNPPFLPSKNSKCSPEELCILLP